MTVQETRWLDPRQQRDWRATIVGMTYLMRGLSADLESATGLSMPEYELLVRLSEAPEHRARMSDLADQVAHSRSRITHTVSRLERAGLVERAPDVGDRRGVLAELTALGYERLVAAAPLHVESVRSRLVDVVSDRQLHDLGEAMRTMLERAGVDLPDPTAERSSSSTDDAEDAEDDSVPDAAAS